MWNSKIHQVKIREYVSGYQIRDSTSYITISIYINQQLVGEGCSVHSCHEQSRSEPEVEVLQQVLRLNVVQLLPHASRY